MNIREAISLALSSLRSNKMRAFLTLLGIIVGIASVITIMTLGHSLKTQANQSIVSSGANDLMVSVQSRPDEGESQRPADPFGGMMGSMGGEAPDEESMFDSDDIDRIKTVMGDSIAGVPIGGNGGSYLTLSKGENTAESSVVFANKDFLDLNPLDIVAGRNISQKDIDEQRPVIVIDQQQLDTFYQGDVTAAVGKEIEIALPQGGSTVAVVVGVYQPEVSTGAFAAMNMTWSTSYMPYTVEPSITGSTGTWSTISVRPAEGKDLAQVKAQLQSVLTNMYQSNEAFTAEIRDFSDMTESFNDILNGISAAISAIAGISLLVGGIGVMNIMLVTVTERTREIGVRKALGATRGAIRLQFVVEAMIVCLVGGLIGVVLGGVLGSIGSNLLGTFVLPPVGVVVLALGFSLAIGLFFGYYPANKAAKMDPIDALRYE